MMNRAAGKGGTAKPALWIWNSCFVAYVHLVAALSLLFFRPASKTVVMMFGIWLGAGIGITMGYHRLWSHRAFSASLPLRIILAVLGTMGFQGSIKWWSERHRLHHRFTDTEHDPYNATRGFWFSHIGWIFHKPEYRKLILIDTQDLLADPIVRYQHKFYVPLAIVLGFVVPSLLAYSWNDFFGGVLYAGHVAKIVIWHSTFCINSFAHWLGSQDFSLEHTARGSLVLAVLTQGEGHHNFHHEFPKDYRNGYNLSSYDPTKWLIQLCTLIGWARNLHVTSEEDIKKALVVTAEKKLKMVQQKLNWGPHEENLRKMTRQQVEAEVHQGKGLLIVDRIVYDVSSYASTHPGGTKVLENYFGQDATVAFNGGLNMHTQAARIKAKTLMYAKLID